MEKVAEQHILQKCSKCSCFGVMSTLLKVATIAITHLAMDLGLKNTKQANFRLYKSATTHLWQPSKSTKKNNGRTPEKKNHGSHLVNTRGSHLVFPNRPKKIPRQVFPMMNLSCKFGSSSYNILRDRKAFVKT